MLKGLNKLGLISALCFTGLISLVDKAEAANVCGSAAPTGWVESFCDDFNSLVSGRWNIYNGPQGGDTQNQFMSDDVFVNNGVLYLRSQKRYAGGRPYTTGGLDTQLSFKQAYGRWEMIAKAVKGKGLLPYAGMFSYPYEIDIMEVLGKASTTNYMTYHWNQSTGYNSGYYTGPDFSAGFHNFAAEWEPNEIRYYVDGALVYTYRGTTYSSPSYFAMGLGVWKCGTWVDCPDGSTQFPAYFQVDSLRVFKKGTSTSASNQNTDYKPVGYLDGVDVYGNASGWAVDPTTVEQSIDIHFYVDGPYGQGGTFIGSTKADRPRADVNGLGYPGNHAFLYTVPAQYKGRKIYAYGIDTTVQGNNSLLSGVPKVFN